MKEFHALPILGLECNGIHLDFQEKEFAKHPIGDLSPAVKYAKEYFTE